MKSVLFTLIFLIAISVAACFDLGKDQYYVKLTGAVNITNIHIPDTINVNDTAPIILKAEAYDACWSDLRFLLSKINDFEYTVQALGTYESSGNCPTATVTGDSTISFKGTKAGIYRFSFYKSAEVTEIDTLVVK
jgi:hypothetical protein